MAEVPIPLDVYEDGGTGNRFVAYVSRNGVELDCLFDGEQPWFTMADFAAIYGVTVPTINEHIQRFKADGELDDSTLRDFFIVRREGTRDVKRSITHYGLDVAFYVGYRVNSAEGKLFRRWATNMLVQLATKGFVVHQRRLKGGENADRVRELREIIRDIRSEEANLYAELRNVCAMCQDYQPDSKAATKFYQVMQAKLFYAVVSLTPSHVIAERADPAHPAMGLHSWQGDRVLQADALVGKNYLGPGEVRELNRLVGILLDIFEDQLEIGKLTIMAECADLLDAQLRQLSRAVLERPGPPSSAEAKRIVKERYAEFNVRRRELEKARTDSELAQLKAAAKALPKAAKSAVKRKAGK